MAESQHIVYPTPAMASKQVISSYAEEVALALGFEVGIPIEPIVSSLGGSIEYKNAVSFGPTPPECIVVRADGDFTIYLGTLTSPERDRFTIAHELGHLFIHYPIVSETHPGATMVATRWVDETDGVQRRAEWEANWFAASFLMPEAAFRQHADAMDIVGLASTFFVSVSAAEVRKKSLGLP